MGTLIDSLVSYCVAAETAESLYEEIKTAMQGKNMNQKDCKALFLSIEIIKKISKKISNKQDQAEFEMLDAIFEKLKTESVRFSSAKEVKKQFIATHQGMRWVELGHLNSRTNNRVRSSISRLIERLFPPPTFPSTASTSSPPAKKAAKKRKVEDISQPGEAAPPPPLPVPPPDQPAGAGAGAAAAAAAAASSADASDSDGEEEEEEEESSSSDGPAGTKAVATASKKPDEEAKEAGEDISEPGKGASPQPPPVPPPGERSSMRIRAAAADSAAAESDGVCSDGPGTKKGSRKASRKGDHEKEAAGPAVGEARQPKLLIIPDGKDSRYFQEHLTKESWVAFKLTQEVVMKIKGILARATIDGCNLCEQVVMKGVAMNKVLQPGDAKRTMFSEGDFSGDVKPYLDDICAVLRPCLEEALRFVNPEERYQHILNCFVAICQRAVKDGVVTVEAQTMHTDVAKECLESADLPPNAKNISVLITVDEALFGIWPGSHLLKQMHCSIPGCLDTISDQHLRFEELTLTLPAYSIILFFGSAVHKGGHALTTNSGYQLRFFQYCDPNPKYSKNGSPRNHTYVDGIDPFFKCARRFLKTSGREQYSC